MWGGVGGDMPPPSPGRWIYSLVLAPLGQIGLRGRQAFRETNIAKDITDPRVLRDAVKNVLADFAR